MRRICAWCKKELTPATSDSTADRVVTHGICDTCAEALNARARRGILEFLNELADPVFLVDENARMISANTAAQLLVGEDRTEVEDRLRGDVFECVNADRPGGCGKTEYCRACAIGNAILETLETGVGVKKAPVSQTLKTDDGERHTRLHISTEKVGDAVLLRIDSVE